jgi:asparagine synthetase B (glutamine-hydrolysing)
MAATLRHRGPDDQGTWDWSLGLWHVLMFQAWFDQQKEMDVCRQ